MLSLLGRRSYRMSPTRNDRFWLNEQTNASASEKRLNVLVGILAPLSGRSISVALAKLPDQTSCSIEGAVPHLCPAFFHLSQASTSTIGRLARFQRREVREGVSKTYSFSGVERNVQKMRKESALPSTFTLDACSSWWANRIAFR